MLSRHRVEPGDDSEPALAKSAEHPDQPRDRRGSELDDDREVEIDERVFAGGDHEDRRIHGNLLIILASRDATPAIREGIREWATNEARGASMFVEKSPRNILRVPYVRAIFPEARIVHIVRDGRDVACSMVPACGGGDRPEESADADQGSI